MARRPQDGPAPRAALPRLAGSLRWTEAAGVQRPADFLGAAHKVIELLVAADLGLTTRHLIALGFDLLGAGCEAVAEPVADKSYRSDAHHDDERQAEEVVHRGCSATVLPPLGGSGFGKHRCHAYLPS